MAVAPTAACLLVTFALTVGLNGQAPLPHAPLRASEAQKLMGRIHVESLAATQTRIQFWLNTPTYLAKQVVLDASSFAISQGPNGDILIESAGPVRVTGFTLEQDTNNVAVLQNAEGKVLTWEQAFKLRIGADGTPVWACCPRKE